MGNPFRKRQKKMTDRPEVSPAGEVDEKPSKEQLAENMGKASAAAAERTVDDDERLGPGEVERLRGELDALKVEHQALNDKYVRQYAEFDNFRKRTAKEKLDLLAGAGGDAIRKVLPVLDDMERAIAHNVGLDDAGAMREGFELIYQKLVAILNAQGVKAMQAKGEPFNEEFHDAISRMPAPTDDLKGKVLDVVETGYLMNNKVLRYAKVVVGE